MFSFKWSTPVPSDAIAIRTEVFIHEQGFTAEQEHDALDEVVLHIVLYDGGSPIATGRIIDDGDGTYHIGRLAVLKPRRGEGIGAVLLRHMEEKAAELGAQTILLGAQAYAAEFYEKSGYTAYGEQYMDCHVPHINMRKKL